MNHKNSHKVYICPNTQTLAKRNTILSEIMMTKNIQLPKHITQYTHTHTHTHTLIATLKPSYAQFGNININAKEN